MPFTFKLSQRLARMRAVGLPSSAAVVAACRLVPVAAPRRQVVVRPDPITLSPVQHTPVTVSARPQASDRCGTLDGVYL